VKNSNKIIYRNFIQKKYLKLEKNNKIKKNCSTIIDDIIKNLDTNKNNFHSLSKNFKLNFRLKDLKKFRKFDTVVVIGMGGSILGAESIYCFLKKKIKKTFLFLNDINEDQINNIKKKSLSDILFILVSKSGDTIETFSNIVALKMLKKNSKNIIIISEKNNNILHSLSQKMNLFYIEHKKYIGGRYSVLSEVGVVPAFLMGVNIHKLRNNLLTHFKSKKKNFLKYSATKIFDLLYGKKFKNLIFLNYDPKLDKFLFWVQQLIGESLGKNNMGFLPVVSTAPKDHHSLLQLYLDGPKDKIFYIFSSNTGDKKKLNFKFSDKKMNFLKNKSLNQIKVAQKNSFMTFLKKNKIPHREFVIQGFDEQILGELFSYFMLETAIIGKLANINPFDQPAVQQIKNNTKKILSQ